MPSERILQMGSSPQITKTWKPKYTPNETGSYFVNEKDTLVPGKVSVTVKDKITGKEYTNEAEAKLYATAEELISAAFGGSLEKLLDEFNGLAIDKATAKARALGYVQKQGPKKSIYVMARKIHRDAVNCKQELSPREAFDIAVTAYSWQAESKGVEYDEAEITKNIDVEPDVESDETE